MNKVQSRAVDFMRFSYCHSSEPNSENFDFDENDITELNNKLNNNQIVHTICSCEGLKIKCKTTEEVIDIFNSLLKCYLDNILEKDIKVFSTLADSYLESEKPGVTCPIHKLEVSIKLSDEESQTHGKPETSNSTHTHIFPTCPCFLEKD